MSERSGARKRKYRNDGYGAAAKQTTEGPGVWASCIKGKEKQTVGELYELFDRVSDQSY